MKARHMRIPCICLILCFSTVCIRAADVPVPAAEELQKLIGEYAAYVALPPDEQAKASKPVYSYPPLTKEGADQWRKALWLAWIVFLKNSRSKAEIDSGDPWIKGQGIVQGTLHLAPGKNTNFSTHYGTRQFGAKPEKGWPLYINLHSGGTNKANNDNMWALTKSQYPIKIGRYISPRSILDTAESWHEPNNYVLLSRLLAEAYALWDIDPNRVYIMGFSMGGWGTLHLAPSIPDYWAAAAASSGAGFLGATNRASPDNLRNTPMMIQVGTEDKAFGRYPLSKAFAEAITALHEKDPDGYVVKFKAHQGKGHQINDRDTPNWLAGFTRDPLPKKIVWQQPVPMPDKTSEDIAKIMQSNFGFSEYYRRRCYWLRNSAPGASQRVVAMRDGNTINLEQIKQLANLTILLDDRMADLDKPVRVVADGKPLSENIIQRQVGTLIATLVERGDPELVFSAELTVKLVDSAAQLEKQELKTVDKLLERAEYRQMQKRYVEATADIEAALKLDPSQGPLVLFPRLQQLAKLRDDPADKLKVLQRWAEVKTDNASLMIACAWECMTTTREDLRDAKAALVYAQKALELSGSKDVKILHTLALAYFRNDRIKDAVETERQAVALLPSNLPPEVRAPFETQLKEFEAALKK